MIEEQARVVAVDRQGVWVETQRRSTCGQCVANNSCGTALLSKVLGVRRTRVRVLNPDAMAVTPGDDVVIGIEEQALTRGSLAIYLLPLLSLFIFALLGETLARQMSIALGDLVSIVFGIAGLMLGLFWVRRFSRNISHDPRYQPVMLRRLGPALPLHLQF
jgi:sigma-E factor negative regulatory protein RseC